MGPVGSRPGARWQLWISASVAFVASGCTLVIELVAGRILAPFVGVSLYTWTSIIGVVLAALSAGALAGGRLADRVPRNESLGWLLIGSGLAALVVVPMVRWLGPVPLATSLMLRITILTAFVFFAPCFLLGAITPVAIRLAVRDLDATGSIVGRITALSTLGAIVGTFATGFVLISHFGTRSILLGIAAGLTGLGLCAVGIARPARRHRLAGLLLVPVVFGLAGSARTSSWLAARDRGAELVEESNYFTIELDEYTRADGRGPLQVLSLDHLIHSYTDVRDPTFLVYDYLQGVADLVTVWSRGAGGRGPRSLFLGGGGYTFPRYLEARYPGNPIDVVEIDPAVTRVATDHLGLGASTAIRTINEDARWFVSHFDGRPYDLIVVDVFNDLAVPYHVATLEFYQRLRELLTPRGVLVVHVLDRFDSGQFLPAVAFTIRRAFGRERTMLWAHERSGRRDLRDSYLVLATRRDQVAGDLTRRLRGCAPCRHRGRVLSRPELGAFLTARRPILLTDDFAPVDRLVLSLFDATW